MAPDGRAATCRLATFRRAPSYNRDGFPIARASPRAFLVLLFCAFSSISPAWRNCPFLPCFPHRLATVALALLWFLVLLFAIFQGCPLRRGVRSAGCGPKDFEIPQSAIPLGSLLRRIFKEHRRPDPPGRQADT